MSGDVCCLGGGMGARCTAANMCNAGSLACTSPMDCPQGDVCCGMLGIAMVASSCKPQGMCTGQQLCTPGTGMMQCPMGQRCMTVLGGIGVCSGRIRDAGGGG
jgi:hypothetical protein